MVLALANGEGGVGVALSADVVCLNGKKRSMIRVRAIDPKGPAAQSSLRVNDVLLAIDGRDASSLEALVKGLVRGPCGSTLQLRVQTPGHAASREVSVQRSGSTAPASAREVVGDQPFCANESCKENASVNCTSEHRKDGDGSSRDRDEQLHASWRELETLQSALAEAEEKLASKDRELECLRAQLALPAGNDNWAAIDRLNDDLAETRRELASAHSAKEEQGKQLEHAVTAIRSLHEAVYGDGHLPALGGPGLALVNEVQKLKHKVVCSRVKVEAVAPLGAAGRSGIVKVNDTIEMVDDQDVSVSLMSARSENAVSVPAPYNPHKHYADTMLTRALYFRSNHPTFRSNDIIQRLEADAVRHLLEGPVGSEVRLRGTGRDSRPYEVTLRRQSHKQDREHTEEAGGGEGRRRTDCIKNQGRDLYEAASALYRVAVWHVHRVQQLERHLHLQAGGSVNGSADGGSERQIEQQQQVAVAVAEADCPPQRAGATAVLAKHIGARQDSDAGGGQVAAAPPAHPALHPHLPDLPDLHVPYLQEAMINVQRAVESIYPTSYLSPARRPPPARGGGGGGGAVDGMGGIGVALGIEALRLQGNLVRLFKVTDTLKSTADCIQRGDLLLAINGEPISGKTYDQVRALIRGQPGSEVRVKGLRRFPKRVRGGKPSDQTFEVTIVRG